MATTFRWLLRGFLLLAGLAVLALLLAYYLASRSLPDYDAEFRVEGIDAPVRIVRDNSAVPHIFGESDPDVFFGLGFAHAQDRLWQMVTLRRAAQGRLSELFGKRTLETDELMRRLDLYGLATQSVAAQDKATKAALEAYAAGVNARIRAVNARALGRGAPEFFLFGGEIAFWQPADSIAIIKLMALRLSGHLAEEVLRANASLALPEKRLADLLPDPPGAGIAALPDYASLVPDTPRQVAALDRSGGPFSPAAPPALAGASNAWTAAPDRAAAGGALLANDPHLAFSAPSIWYLARVELASGGVIGATIPGVPAVLLGRSAALGWGLTSAYVDDQDLFIEAPNPDDPGEYRTPDGYAPFRTRRSIIRIKDAPPETVTLRWTENGPVLPGRFFDIASITPQGDVAALSWTGLTGDDTSMTAALRLMRAKSVDEAIAAGELFVAPSQNLMVTDGTHIAMQTIGRMPRRNPGHQSKGRLPTPGWRAVNRWQGMFDYAANPRFKDPAGGILGNTNNKMVDRPFPRHVSYFWGDTQRIRRWRKLMQEREVQSRESFIEAQLDTVSITARTLLTLVGRELWFAGDPAATGTRAHRRQTALDMLREWNGEMNEHLPEPLIYAAWMRELQDRLIRDELGPLADGFTHLRPLFVERVFRDTDGASAWCDVKQSSATETCPEIARQSLDAALIGLAEKYGGSLDSLRWGNAHMAHQDHRVLGGVPGLSWLVNIRQSTSGGDNTLLRGATSGTPPDPFANVHGPGYRGVYDFADPDSSVFILSTGQSGHPLSRHYDDLGELWRRGDYIPMSLDPALARAASVGTDRLLPESAP